MAGDISNTGSILQNGIAVTNSNIAGAISNVGSLAGGNITTFAGGIATDSRSSISGVPIGIGLIGIPTFSGGINNNATISGNSNGIYVDSVTSFAGGINNSGPITAANGISVSNITNFTGGISNGGKLTTSNYGITELNVANFGGGIFNSGDINSTGVNRAGVSLFDLLSAGTFSGGITNTGKISAVGAGVTLGDNLCLCSPTVSFAGGISNGGIIAGGFAGIFVGDITKFSGNISNTGAISGNTGLILFYNGSEGISVFNAGTITGAGGTAIEFGGLATLTIAPTSVINGKVTGLGNNTLQLGGSGVGTFDVSSVGPSAKYEGFNTFNKVDSSTWSLIGTGSFGGPVNVNGGTLSVNGSLATASMTTVNPGGVLGGTGIVGNTTINGGMLAPGNSIGLLTVQGSLTFSSAATYLVEVAGTAVDRVVVSGSAALNGSVNVVSPPNNYRFNFPYVILNAGTLNGTQFANLIMPAGIAGSLSYPNASVVLNLTSALGQLTGITTNQRAVAAAIDAQFNIPGGQPGPFAPLFVGNVSANLAQLTGEGATGSQQTTFDAMAEFVGTLFDHPTGGQPSNNVSTLPYANDNADDTTGGGSYAARTRIAGTNSERDARAMMTKAPLRDPIYAPHWSVWAAGFGGTQTTDGNATVGSNTTSSRIFGTAVGADYLLSPQTVAGVAMAGAGTSFSVANSGSGRSDVAQAGGFVRHAIGPTYVSGALAYGWEDVTTDRTVTIAGTDQLRAQFNANALTGRLEGGYRFATPWIGLTPYAAGQFTTLWLPAYAEQAISGTNTFALAYGSRSVTDPRSELGLRGDRSFVLTNAVLTLRGRAAWAHDFNPNRSIAATFQTLPGASFVVNGAAQASDSALTTASAEMAWVNGWSVAASFDGEFSRVTRSYAGKGVVRYQW